jgi:hypothetical protein
MNAAYGHSHETQPCSRSELFLYLAPSTDVEDLWGNVIFFDGECGESLYHG